MLQFGPKLNRCYSVYLPFSSGHVSITIFFSKTNTFLGFKTDNALQDMCKENVATVNTYKDLKNSLFASTFLDIRDFKSDNLDIRCQFSNILPDFQEKLQYVTNESIKLSKVTTNNGTFESLVYLYGFTFTDYQDDFLFLLCERQHIDTVLNKKLVRTAAIQISTPDCLENMCRTAEHYKGEGVYDKSGTDDISGLFPDKDNINVRKL